MDLNFPTFGLRLPSPHSPAQRITVLFFTYPRRDAGVETHCQNHQDKAKEDQVSPKINLFFHFKAIYSPLAALSQEMGQHKGRLKISV